MKAGHKGRILVVDDNKGLGLIVQMILELEGYDVRLARDGEEGYGTYLDFRPDLVITDIEMPGKNGFELMREIKTHNPNISTIYMSADSGLFWSLPKEDQEAYRVSCLEKPFSREILMGLVSKHLKRAYRTRGQSQTPHSV
ncbi:MAG: response regulator [Deltaproteobacteria bacterium]|nr:response regulator [Deltaproteobacteria bacterium]